MTSRARAAVAIALALAAGACSAAGSLPSPRPAASPRAAPAAYRMAPFCTPPDPHAPPPTVSVASLNRIVSGLDLRYWQAGDIGASARLSDHRIVWVFGDTLRSSEVSPRMVSNSVLVTSGLCSSQVLPRSDGALIPDRGDGVAHWPMSVAVIPHVDGEAFVVTTARIRRADTGALDFTYLGSSAHLFTVERGGTPQLQHQIDITPDNPDPHQVNWGSAMTTDGSWLYTYGTRLPDGAAFGRSLHVARAPVADPRARSRWQFWDGRRWARDPEAAAAVLPAEGGVSQTLSVSLVNDRYVIVSKRDGDLGDTVYSWTSKSPVGPWTPRRGVRAEFRDAKGLLRYAPLAHPSIRLDSGGLLISISRNTTDFPRLLQQPRLGRPVFAELDQP